MSEQLEIRIDIADITEIQADVLALKYARSFHGADRAVCRRMIDAGTEASELAPEIGEYRLLLACSTLGARSVLMVGTPTLSEFRYTAIREFSGGILRYLAKEQPKTSSLAMTIHGPGYGLDEGESLSSQVRGYLDALDAGTLPPTLRRISVVEKRESRAFRLWQSLEKLLSERPEAQKVEGEWAFRLPRRRAGVTAPPPVASPPSESKPHAFVAMPFTRPMDDVYYFGIEQPVHAMGLLCERVDQASFTGHILDQIRERIDSAAVVIADLSGGNPNVYLEVGYAWGRGRPTILLVQDVKDLRFDVQSQRCLVYERIIDLTRLLSNELQRLKGRGILQLP